MVTLLIQAKADVNAVNEDKRSALHLAARSGKTDILNELIKSGAKLNARTSDGRTALHIALWRNNTDVVNKLVEAGADVNIQDEDGWTPLFWAANQITSDVTKLLLDNGAKLNLVDKRGFNALHVALTKSNFDTAKVLMHEGADLNMKVQGRSFVTLLLNKNLTSSKAIEMLSYSVLCGYNLRNDFSVRKGTIKQFSKDESFQQWLEGVQTHVDSLSCLCRIQIRNRLTKRGLQLKPAINKLPLPKLLLSYLKFDNVQDNEEIT